MTTDLEGQSEIQEEMLPRPKKTSDASKTNSKILMPVLSQAFLFFLTVKRIFAKCGWSLMDPCEPLLVIVLIFCVITWFLSFSGATTFPGYVVTLAIALAWSRIRLLGSLKEQLDRFAAENDRLKESVQVSSATCIGLRAPGYAMAIDIAHGGSRP